MEIKNLPQYKVIEVLSQELTNRKADVITVQGPRKQFYLMESLMNKDMFFVLSGNLCKLTKIRGYEWFKLDREQGVLIPLKG